MVEFAHKYEFTAMTLNPIRGIPEENIFEPIDKQAFEYMRKIIPIAEQKSKEYGIRFNNWMPIDCGCEQISFKHSTLDVNAEEKVKDENIQNNIKKENKEQIENNIKKENVEKDKEEKKMAVKPIIE